MGRDLHEDAVAIVRRSIHGRLELHGRDHIVNPIVDIAERIGACVKVGGGVYRDGRQPRPEGPSHGLPQRPVDLLQHRAVERNIRLDTERS